MKGKYLQGGVRVENSRRISEGNLDGIIFCKRTPEKILQQLTHKGISKEIFGKMPA